MPGARGIANSPSNDDGSQMIHAFPRESIIAGNIVVWRFTMCVPRCVDTGVAARYIFLHASCNAYNLYVCLVWLSATSVTVSRGSNSPDIIVSYIITLICHLYFFSNYSEKETHMSVTVRQLLARNSRNV